MAKEKDKERESKLIRKTRGILDELKRQV